MGNTDAKKTEQASKRFDEYLASISELSNKTLLGDTRLFKTLRFMSAIDNFSIILKLHIRSENSSRENYSQNYDYFLQKKSQACTPFLLFYQRKLFEKEIPFLFIVRQYVGLTLYDKLHYIFALNKIEKIWIILQLLLGIYDIHENLNLFHGDLKPSNIMMTSKNQVLISDFAFYKPFYIDETNLNALSFYYPNYTDRCYIAPEKLVPSHKLAKKTYSPESSLIKDIDKKKIGKLQKMDIFSLGCIFAEIMCDGQSLFTYEDLQKYKRDVTSVEDLREKLTKTVDKIKRSSGFMINQKEIKILDYIIHMVNKKPEERLTISDYLKKFITEIMQYERSSLTIHIMCGIYNTAFAFPDHLVAIIRLILPTILKVCLRKKESLKRPLPLPLQGINLLVIFQKIISKLPASLATMLHPFELVIEEEQKNINFLQIPLQSEQEFNLEKGRNLQIQSLKELIRENLEKSLTPPILKKEIKIYSPDKIKKALAKVSREGYLERAKASKKSFETKLMFPLLLILCSQLRNLCYENSKLMCIELITYLSQEISQNKMLRYVLPYLTQLLGENENPEVSYFALKNMFFILKKFTNPFRNLSDCFMLRDLCFFLFEFVKKDNLMNRGLIIQNLDILLRVELLSYYLNESTPQAQETDETIKERYYNLISSIISSYNEKGTYIQPLDFLLESLQKISFLLGQNYVDSLMSNLNPLFNKNFIKALESLQSISCVVSPVKAKNYCKPCIETCLYHANDRIKLKTLQTLKMFLAHKKYHENDEIDFIKKILPLLIYPMRQIRKATLELVETFINGIEPAIYYCFLADHISKFCKDNVKYKILEKGCLKLIVANHLTDKCLKQMESFNQLKSDENRARESLNKISKDASKWNNYQKDFYELYFKKRTLNDDALVKSEESINLENFKKIDNKEVINKLLADFVSCQISLQFGQISDLKIDEDSWTWLDKINYLREIIKMTEDFDLEKQLNSYTLQSFYNMQNLISFHICAKEILSKFLVSLAKCSGNDESKRSLTLSQAKKNSIVNLSPDYRPFGLLYTTINEHTQTISSLQIIDNTILLSASLDGQVKLFSLEKIDKDFTVKSYINIKAVKDLDSKDAKSSSLMRIKCLKSLNTTNNFVYGTESGVLDLFSYSLTQKKTPIQLSLVRRYITKGEIKAVDNFEIMGEKAFVNCFSYATNKGIVAVEDFRQKQRALQYNIGPWRGTITSVLATKIPNILAITTINGYLMLLDLRLNILSGIYQLKRKDHRVPILSVSNYTPPNQHIQSLESDYNIPYFILNYQSEKNEFSIFNMDILNSYKERSNPSFHFHAHAISKIDDELPMLPYLENVTTSEIITNYDDMSYADRIKYAYFLEDHTQTPSNRIDLSVSNRKSIFNLPFYDIINFYEEPLKAKLSKLKDAWLSDSSLFFNQINDIYSNPGTLNKIIALPNSAQDLFANSKREYPSTFLMAGNDCSVRFFSVGEDAKKKKSGHFKPLRSVLGYHVCGNDHNKKTYLLYNSADTSIIKERNYDQNQEEQIKKKKNLLVSLFTKRDNKEGKIEFPGISDFFDKNGYSFNGKEKISNPNHLYGISDMIFLQRNNSYFIATGSQDGVIKIWK